jgi:hypothetical protein
MPEEIAKMLAAEIVNSGYQVVSEAEINEMRDAIRQREIMTMTTKQKKLFAMKIAVETLIEKIFVESNAAMMLVFIAALDLQQNIQDALDELNSELHLETYQN